MYVVYRLHSFCHSLPPMDAAKFLITMPIFGQKQLHVQASALLITVKCIIPHSGESSGGLLVCLQSTMAGLPYHLIQAVFMYNSWKQMLRNLSHGNVLQKPVPPDFPTGIILRTHVHRALRTYISVQKVNHYFSDYIFYFPFNVKGNTELKRSYKLLVIQVDCHVGVQCCWIPVSCLCDMER